MPDQWLVLIAGPTLVEEVRKMPDDAVSLAGGADEVSPCWSVEYSVLRQLLSRTVARCEACPRNQRRRGPIPHAPDSREAYSELERFLRDHQGRDVGRVRPRRWTLRWCVVTDLHAIRDC